MSVVEFNQPARFVAGTVGEPGSREFYLQVRDARRVEGVAIEKQQVALLAERLEELLDEVGEAVGLVERGAQLPHVPDDVDPAYHLFFVLLPDAERRPEIMGALKDRGINTTFHYVPLHNSEGGRRFALRDTDCPVTIEVSSRLIRLPFYNNLTEADQDRVIEALLELV